MRLAIAKAREGIDQGQLPYGAVIVKNGSLISNTHNTIYDDSNILSHAETNAIIEACKKLGTLDLTGCTLYATCEPCPMCFGACVLARIARLVYSSRLDDGILPGFSILAIASEELKEKGHAEIEITGDFLREESITLFEIWKKRRG